MMSQRLLITGSSGLVGSECVRFFDRMGWEVHGVDNNMRRTFFGSDGDTQPVLHRLKAETGFHHHDIDIRQREDIADLYREIQPQVTIHCAAQPSHDLARTRTLEDFEINATATLGLLLSAHQYAREGTFLFMSTNKVYGDAPNQLPLEELETRWDYSEPAHFEGVDESCRIDASTHSFFGVSKAAADLLVQEFGRCYGMNTACFRGGCLTGPDQSSAELHGFLSYLVRAAKEGREYTIFGHKGKQVRDNLHTTDVCSAFWSYINNPRPAAVYNLGGGRQNSVSMLEAIAAVEQRLEVKMKTTYSPEARLGDHICYISDMTRFRQDYPDWEIEYPLERIFDDLCLPEISKRR
jgi:CDP-paratose 2-epimerase